MENVIFDEDEHESNKKVNAILKYLECSKAEASQQTENHDMSFEEIDFRAAAEET